MNRPGEALDEAVDDSTDRAEVDWCAQDNRVGFQQPFVVRVEIISELADQRFRAQPNASFAAREAKVCELDEFGFAARAFENRPDHPVHVSLVTRAA